MDRLEELRKKIYAKKPPEERKKEFFGLKHKKEEGPKPYWDEDLNVSLEEKLAQEKAKLDFGGPSKKGMRFKIFITVAILSLLVIAASAAYIYFSVFYEKQDVVFSIAAKDLLDSGSIQTWEVIMNNDGDINIKSGELTFVYPEGAIPLFEDGLAGAQRKMKTIAGLRSREKVSFTFAARLFGNAGEEKKAEAVITYQPENLSSPLSMRLEHKTIISRVPLAISYQIPEKIVSGQELTLKIEINSTSETVFEDLFLKLDYPTSFDFKWSDKKPDFENNIWKIGNLSQGQSASFLVKGDIYGLPDEVMAVIAGAGRYDPEKRDWKAYVEESIKTKVASPPLFVRQSSSAQGNVIKFGDDIRYDVYYKNNLEVPVRDVFVRAKILNESLTEPKNLSVEGGYFDGKTREVIWTAPPSPQLKEIKPGGEGVLRFFIRTIERPPISTFSDKNFVIRSSATINTETVPDGYEGTKLEYQDIYEIKIQSALRLFARAVYYDSPLGPNIGSLPPRVKQETGYTVIFEVSAASNDLKDVVVKAALPGNVRWLNQITGDRTDKIFFNSSSGEIVWNVGGVLAGTGIIRPRLSIALNVAVRPGEDVLGEPAVLVRDIKASGTDVFTGKSLEDVPMTALNTNLGEDPKSRPNQWVVVE